MKISIVMSFFERQEQLDYTLRTIDQSSIKDYELVITDDGSPTPLVCDRAEIIRVEQKDKWYYNTCIPYNMALDTCTGDVIIIQNPECAHMGDVLKYVNDHIKDGIYLSFACAALDKLNSDKMRSGAMVIINDMAYTTRSGWYNHPEYNPTNYHFCTAITREDLDISGKFDERYAQGFAFEDNAFLRQVQRAGIRVVEVTKPFVVHQWHEYSGIKDRRLWEKLHEKNRALFQST